jgi:hydrogenase-4 component E
MTTLADSVLVLVMLVNFVLLGTRWIRVTIRAAAVQGAILSVLPLLVERQAGWHALAMAAATMALKGLILPGLLQKAIRDVHIRHEVQPYVGFVPSLFLGAAGTGLAVIFAGSLPLAPEHAGSLTVPAALATLMTGFLLLTTRKKAISQVVGYFVLENGIFLFGLLLLDAMPRMIEIGVLLDLFVAILVMGIIINHIRDEFSSLDTELLTELKD